MSRQNLWLYLGLLQGPYFDNTGGSPGALRYSSLKSYSLPQVLYSLILTLRITLCFNSMWIKKFQMNRLDLEKAEEPEFKLPIYVGSQKKQESFREASTSASLTMLKSLWITTNCGKFFERWKYQTTLSASREICMQVKKQQLEPDMEQQDSFQIGKEVCQGCILSPWLFNLYAEYIMQNVRWMKHKLESRLPGQISITSDMQMTPPLWQKAKN